MSSPSNEYAYAKQFVGNLRAEPEPVPVHLTTRLRVLSGETACDIRPYRSRAFDAPPRYIFGGGNLSLHPSLQAVGRHYFTW